jgi:hypothetical protein
MTFKVIGGNTHVCSKLMTRTIANATVRNASRSESKKQHDNPLFHCLSLAYSPLLNLFGESRLAIHFFGTCSSAANIFWHFVSATVVPYEK